MTLDTRWKNPQGPAQLYLWAQDLIKELRKGSFPSSSIVGTTTNDDAPEGNIGELLSSFIASGSAVSLTTGVAANITSILITPGDWDVTANAYFSATATTSITRTLACIVDVSAGVGTNPGQFSQHRTAAAVAGTSSLAMRHQPIPPYRVSFAVPVTLYLVALADFSADTLAAWGSLTARRVR